MPTAHFYDQAQPTHFECDGPTLAVRRFGSGPPLLLIHGFPLHGFTWRHLLPELARSHTCWVVDLPGLGDAPAGLAAQMLFTAQARRLAAWVRSLDLRHVGVIAHDTGATLARLLALAEPERISQLALINTEMPGHRPPYVPFYQQASHWPGAVTSFRLLLRSRLWVRSPMGLGGLFTDPALLDGEFDARFLQPLRTDPQRMLDALRYLQGFQWDVMDGLREGHGRIRAPVILIWGEDDPTFPIEHAEKMATQFANLAGFHPIPGARLMPHEERPEQVLSTLRPFLARQP